MTDILVVGNGAREHALAWKFRQNSSVERLFVAPGNGGTHGVAENVELAGSDVEGLLQFALSQSIDLTVVGPELPLALGIVDRFQRHGLAIFGPTKEACQLECSKSFTRELASQAQIPGPLFHVFSDITKAEAFLARHNSPVVVKADGLAAGKGVVLCYNRIEALAAVQECMSQRVFGSAGDVVVLEEFLSGPEISVFAFCDGNGISPMVAACDYKRALDGDQGLNTGGMGCYTPPTAWTADLEEKVRLNIIQPTLAAMAERGTPYVGVLYAGLMLTEDGPKLLEFNCRLGDPEAQVVLPLLEGNLLPVLQACVHGDISGSKVTWANEACVGVVLVSGGYPGDYLTGQPMAGLDDLDDDVLLFHAGTTISSEDNRLVTDGGRVLTVVGRGPSVGAARERAYANIDRISFGDSYFRKDIALLPDEPDRQPTHDEESSR